MIRDLIPPAAWMIVLGILLGAVIVVITAFADEVTDG